MHIETIAVATNTNDWSDLAGLLIACVENGASIGFLAPLARAEAEAYWKKIAGDLPGGFRVLLVARETPGGPIVGSVQAAFSENWTEETGELFLCDDVFPRLEPAGEIVVHAAYDITAFTDESGVYRLTQLPGGPVVLEVFYSGLDPQQIALNVTAGQTLTLTRVSSRMRGDGTWDVGGKFV